MELPSTPSEDRIMSTRRAPTPPEPVLEIVADPESRKLDIAPGSLALSTILPVGYRICWEPNRMERPACKVRVLLVVALTVKLFSTVMSLLACSVRLLLC